MTNRNWSKISNLSRRIAREQAESTVAWTMRQTPPRDMPAASQVCQSSLGELQSHEAICPGDRETDESGNKKSEGTMLQQR